jgi:hypothetical protein
MSLQQLHNTCISHERPMDSLNKHIVRLQEDIKERRESIFAGMSWQVVERAMNNPEYLHYLRNLIDLKGAADMEVVVTDANLCTAGQHVRSDDTLRPNRETAPAL